MNCRQGDLARVVLDLDVPNRDRIVQCIRLATSAELGVHFIKSDAPVWVVDRDLEWASHFVPLRMLPFAPDAVLRPIRGTEGTDQTLEWKSVPRVCEGEVA